MKVFLLSDLVAHELVSMQLDEKWLTSGQFQESVQLWISRHAPEGQLSKKSLAMLQVEAIRIAERLMQDVRAGRQESQPGRLLLDIHAVDYADPLSARILAASLETCRSTLCHVCSQRAEQREAKRADEAGWRCDPVLQRLLCGAPGSAG
ncbi:hypothetical protein [Paraburkholderia azotifigens]|uniref:Uncharacterized protein n=1 Tax=Paraburkholderia azotifigens TaxID=2057004 RepID=A0ABU9RBF1_9BURK